MLKRCLSLIYACLTAQFVLAQTTNVTIEDVFDKATFYHYSHKDSAYYYYEKAIELANQKSDIDYLVSSLSYLMNANGNYYDLTNYERNIRRQDSILNHDERLKDYPYTDYYRDYLLFERGNYYYKLKEYTTSKKYFLQLQKKLLDIPDNELFTQDIEMLSSIYSFLGLIYRHTSRFEQAELTYKKDLALLSTFKDSIEDWESDYFNSKKLLSQVYEEKGELNKANELLQESLDFYLTKSKNKRYKNNLLSTRTLLAKNFVEQENFGKAISVLDENTMEYADEPPFSFEIDLLRADAFMGFGDFRMAQTFYEKALENAIDFRNGQRHQDVARIKGKMASFFLGQKQYDKGLEWIARALNASGHEVDISALSDNPSAEDVFSKKQLLRLMDVKLQLLNKAYLESNDKELLLAAIETNKDILVTFEVLKREFNSKVDKQFLAETAYPIFHRMLAITYEAYKEEASEELFELALNISEKNKDFLLLEALRSANATRYGEIPFEIIEREAQLRAGISNLEKKLFDTEDQAMSFSEDLFVLKREYYVFLDSLKERFPKYHDLKYQDKSLSLNTVRNSLEKDEVLLSYSMSKHHLYTLIVNGDSEDFLKLPFNELDREEVRKFYRLISNPSLKNGAASISESASELYKRILKSVLSKHSSDNLTIIPDDILHYLPFDLLVDNDDFLLESKLIGYANSINSLLAIRQKENTNSKKLLAFAPSFDNQIVESDIRFEFGKLLYNDDEVKKISSVFDSEIYVDQKATLDRFRSVAGGFGMIHLATHASANDEYPDYSYLAFSETGEESNVFYIKDLYNTVLNADMVTLSACQTGIGKLRKGQGMISLSKGFFYAGAKSLVNTLWKINDKSSVRLMEFFYEGLGKGKTKKEALRDAKLKYLETTNDDLLRHPYYWSAFVVSGDTSPIGANKFWWFMACGIVLLGMAGALIWKGRR